MGLLPLEDTLGMKVAYTMLRRSLDPGKWEECGQYASTRKVRSMYSNMFHASCHIGRIPVIAYETSKVYQTDCPAYGYCFERFSLRCHKRMGDKVVSDYSLSIETFNEIIATLELEWIEATTEAERDKITEFASLMMFGFLCSLRGEKIVKADTAGFVKFLLEVSREHPECPDLVVPLLGRLKGEMSERYHMMIFARETVSGLEPGKWADRMHKSL
jgi:hypothetical protein